MNEKQDPKPKTQQLPPAELPPFSADTDKHEGLPVDKEVKGDGKQ